MQEVIRFHSMFRLSSDWRWILELRKVFPLQIFAYESSNKMICRRNNCIKKQTKESYWLQLLPKRANIRSFKYSSFQSVLQCGQSRLTFSSWQAYSHSTNPKSLRTRKISACRACCTDSVMEWTLSVDKSEYASSVRWIDWHKAITQSFVLASSKLIRHILGSWMSEVVIAISSAMTSQHVILFVH